MWKQDLTCIILWWLACIFQKFSANSHCNGSVIDGQTHKMTTVKPPIEDTLEEDKPPKLKGTLVHNYTHYRKSPERGQPHYKGQNGCVLIKRFHCTVESPDSFQMLTTTQLDPQRSNGWFRSSKCPPFF